MARSLTLSEATKFTTNAQGKRLSQVSLRAAAERGALKASKQGGRNWKVTESDLRSYLNGRPDWWKPKRR